MIINPITINKIIKTFEFVCPLFKEELINEAYIVGSVAIGTAKKESDIDIVLYNPHFEQEMECLNTNDEHTDKYLIKLINKLNEYIDKTVHKVEYKLSFSNDFYYQLYKDELFHLMITNEKEYIIKKCGEYIEITKELCDEVD